MTRRGAPYHNLSGEQLITMDFNFRAMQESVARETKDLPPNVGISVALFRLKELMQGYDYAISKGYEVPLQEGFRQEIQSSE